MKKLTWYPPPEHLVLPKGYAHVWWLDIDLSGDKLETLIPLLSCEERDRAARFRRENDHDRFCASYAQLRQVLSRYLNCSPESLEFDVGEHGKPELVPVGGRLPGKLEFNLSHSFQYALVAVARDQAVGVDLEHVTDTRPIEQLAKRFFAKAEVERFLNLPEKQRMEAFYALWTRKEAFLKATGAGVYFGLDRCEMSVDPGVPAQLLKIDGQVEAAKAWSLYDLPFEDEPFAGCLACKGSFSQIDCWRSTVP